jgi:hypothetical protein
VFKLEGIKDASVEREIWNIKYEVISGCYYCAKRKKNIKKNLEFGKRIFEMLSIFIRFIVNGFSRRGVKVHQWLSWPGLTMFL